jgi:hypothetical protein
MLKFSSLILLSIILFLFIQYIEIDRAYSLCSVGFFFLNFIQNNGARCHFVPGASPSQVMQERENTPWPHHYKRPAPPHEVR